VNPLRVVSTALLVALFLAWAPHARALDVKDVPNPRADHNGWVTDSAGVLGGFAADIEARLTLLHDQLGAEVAVAIVPSIGEQSPREFATALFQHWGVGRKGQDDGVLVLHVLDQRRLEIETGYGSESVLPDAVCSWLVQDVAIPFFRKDALAYGHFALSRGIDHALRHPGVSHDDLVAASLDGLVALPAAPLVGSDASAPAAHDGSSWLVPLDQHKDGWMLGAALAALAAVALRVRAHRAFHRDKAAGFGKPWLGALVGALMSGVLFGIGRVSSDSETTLIGPGLLSFTALAVFVRGVWFQLAARKRYAPRTCAACGSAMRLLTEQDDDAHLEGGQRTEERIESRDYDVWLCACGATSKAHYKGAKPATQCASCKFFTDRETSSRVIRAATTSSSGQREDFYCCAQCGKKRTVQVTLAKLSSSSSSSSGGSSSSSFGGGRSGGGGAGGSY